MGIDGVFKALPSLSFCSRSPRNCSKFPIPSQTPKRDLKIRSPEPYGKLYKDDIGVIMGLYRGFNF